MFSGFDRHLVSVRRGRSVVEALRINAETGLTGELGTGGAVVSHSLLCRMFKSSVPVVVARREMSDMTGMCSVGHSAEIVYE